MSVFIFNTYNVYAFHKNIIKMANIHCIIPYWRIFLLCRFVYRLASICVDIITKSEICCGNVGSTCSWCNKCQWVRSVVDIPIVYNSFLRPGFAPDHRRCIIPLCRRAHRVRRLFVHVLLTLPAFKRFRWKTDMSSPELIGLAMCGWLDRK